MKTRTDIGDAVEHVPTGAKERPILFSGAMVLALLEGRKTQTRRIISNMPVEPVVNCHSKHTAKHTPPYFDSYRNGPRSAANPDRISANWCWWQVDNRQCLPTIRCPYGAPGDRLWVRETWATSIYCDDRKPSQMEKPGRGYGWPVWYAADGAVNTRGHGSLSGGPGFTTKGKNRVSIFMPRWASRITLEVLRVRVERVQAISEADALAEGVKSVWCNDGGETPGRPLYFTDVTRPTAGHATAAAAYQELWEAINGAESWEKNPWVWVVEFRVLTAKNAESTKK